MADGHAEAGELLKSEALRAVDAAIAAARGLPLTDGNPVVTLNSVMNSLWHAKLPAPEVRRLLEQDKELIVRLADRHLQTSDPIAEAARDFPGGGEATLLGLGVGVGVTWALYLHYLRDRTPAEFRSYLKAHGVRNAVTLARQLAQAYAEVR
jgi:hypothetical protein